MRNYRISTLFIIGSQLLNQALNIQQQSWIDSVCKQFTERKKLNLHTQFV